MEATRFMKKLQDTSLTNTYADYSNILPDEYFDSQLGKEVLLFLSKEAKVIDEKTFTLTSDIIDRLHKKPIYQGRSFFSDMKALGFTCECTSYHQDEAPIRTYISKVL